MISLCGPDGSSMLCSAAADYTDILATACEDELVSKFGFVSEGKVASVNDRPIIAIGYSNATRPAHEQLHLP